MWDIPCDQLTSVTGHYHCSGGMWQVVETSFSELRALPLFYYWSLALLCFGGVSAASSRLLRWVGQGGQVDDFTALLYSLRYLSFLYLDLSGWVDQVQDPAAPLTLQ